MSFLRRVDPNRGGVPARQGVGFPGSGRPLSSGGSRGRGFHQVPGHSGRIPTPGAGRPAHRPGGHPVRQRPGRPTVVHRGPTHHHHHRSPLFIDPTVTHLPSVHTHETVIVDSGPSHSVTVVDGRSRGKVAMIAALIVGILIAVLGASLLPVNPVAGFTLMGIGGGVAFFSGAGLIATR